MLALLHFLVMLLALLSPDIFKSSHNYLQKRLKVHRFVTRDSSSIMTGAEKKLDTPIDGGRYNLRW
jgi:hypothetical protein